MTSYYSKLYLSQPEEITFYISVLDHGHPGIIHYFKTVPGFSGHHAEIVEILCNLPINKKQRNEYTIVFEQIGIPSIKK